MPVFTAFHLKMFMIDCRMTGEWWIGRDLKGSGIGLIYFRICWKGLSKTTKSSVQDRWRAVKYSIPGPHKYAYFSTARITNFSVRTGLRLTSCPIHGLLQFLCALVKLRKATISFVMSVCPSTWNNLAPTRGTFKKFDTLVFFFFENMSGKFKFH